MLQGNLVIKGNGDPKLVLERMWLLLRRVQQAGVREIRGDIVLDRSAFVPGEINPADFDGEPLRPYNAGADALLLNYRAVLLTFTPDPARGVAAVAVDPPLAGVRVDATVPLAAGPARTGAARSRASFADPARLHFAAPTRRPAASGSGRSPTPTRAATTSAPCSACGRARRPAHRRRPRRRRAATPPSFELRSPPLAEVVRDINKLSNNVMAQQLFLTLGATQRGAGTPEAAREVLRQWLRERVGNAAATERDRQRLGPVARRPAQRPHLGRLLQSAWASPVMPELMSSLPVTGIDGTLRRSQGRPAAPT